MSYKSFYKTVNFNNALWLSGTFSNESATFKDSVWLSGVFNKGTFKNSSFNPYVRRGKSQDYPLNLDNSDYSFTPNFNPPVYPQSTVLNKTPIANNDDTVNNYNANYNAPLPGQKQSTDNQVTVESFNNLPNTYSNDYYKQY